MQLFLWPRSLYDGHTNDEPVGYGLPWLSMEEKWEELYHSICKDGPLTSFGKDMCKLVFLNIDNNFVFRAVCGVSYKKRHVNLAYFNIAIWIQT